MSSLGGGGSEGLEVTTMRTAWGVAVALAMTLPTVRARAEPLAKSACSSAAFPSSCATLAALVASATRRTWGHQ